MTHPHGTPGPEAVQQHAPPLASPPAPPYAAAYAPLAEDPVEAARKERRLMRDGWLLVAVGLLIPPLELGAAAIAIIALNKSRGTAAVAMLVSAIAIFALRLALYVGG